MRRIRTYCGYGACLVLLLVAQAGAGPVDWPGTGDGQAATGPPAPLPKTGQKVSYGPRDDGALEIGVKWPTPRFIDNLNGTVIDRLTGLVWLKNANCFGRQPWNAAIDGASALADGQCGLSDGSRPNTWRLPNTRELHSLIDYGQALPAFPASHPFVGVASFGYWSSTTKPERSGLKWYLSLGYGYVTVGGYQETYYVWPVRFGDRLVDAGGPPAPVPKTGQERRFRPRDDGDLEAGVAWPVPRFIDHLDGTVTDRLTGLVWLKDANCFGYQTWLVALAAANALADGQCGLIDGSTPNTWRLPNVRELHSLIDFGENFPSLPALHPFLGVVPTPYWSSTTDSLTGNGWIVNVHDGSAGVLTSGNALVWPVRWGDRLVDVTPPSD